MVLLLVLIFGNEAFTEWVQRHHGRPDVRAGDYLLNVLTYPNWEFFPDNKSNAAWREWFARDLRAVLVVALVAVILAVGSEALLSRGTGAFGGFVFAWGATMIGAALAGFLAHLILIGTSGNWFLDALHIAAAGAVYGLFFGWLVGLAVLGARRG